MFKKHKKKASKICLNFFFSTIIKVPEFDWRVILSYKRVSWIVISKKIKFSRLLHKVLPAILPSLFIVLMSGSTDKGSQPLPDKRKEVARKRCFCSLPTTIKSILKPNMLDLLPVKNTKVLSGGIQFYVKLVLSLTVRNWSDPQSFAAGCPVLLF